MTNVAFAVKLKIHLNLSVSADLVFKMIDGIINLLSSATLSKEEVCASVSIKFMVLIEHHTKHSNFIPRSLFIDNDPDRPPYKT
jgi:hypothetical protein